MSEANVGAKENELHRAGELVAETLLAIEKELYASSKRGLGLRIELQLSKGFDALRVGGLWSA